MPAAPGKPDSSKAPWYAAGSGITVASLLMLVLPRRRRLGGLLLVALAVALVGGATGCGGSSQAGATLRRRWLNQHQPVCRNLRRHRRWEVHHFVGSGFAARLDDHLHHQLTPPRQSPGCRHLGCRGFVCICAPLLRLDAIRHRDLHQVVLCAEGCSVPGRAHIPPIRL